MRNTLAVLVCSSTSAGHPCHLLGSELDLSATQASSRLGLKCSGPSSGHETRRVLKAPSRSANRSYPVEIHIGNTLSTSSGFHHTDYATHPPDSAARMRRQTTRFRCSLHSCYWIRKDLDHCAVFLSEGLPCYQCDEE